MNQIISLIINILELSSLFGLVAMGVYITYKILDFPDLSVDGTYPLGACIVAALLVKGVNPWVATLCALLGGAIAGFVTAFLHVKVKITNLMSGVLVMMGLYSVNLMIMGKSNTPLFTYNHIFNGDKLYTSLNNIFSFTINGNTYNLTRLFIIVVFLVIFKILLDLFMKTKVGFLLFAVGDNEQVVTTLGVNKNNIKIIGLMLSNALVALAGGLTAQYNGVADVGLGTGIVVKGLACVIIGSSIFGRFKFIKSTSQAIIGSILYYTAISIALYFNFNTNLLNLLTAIVIVIALASQNDIFGIKKRKLKKAGEC